MLFPANPLASTEKTKGQPGDAVANTKSATELQQKINSNKPKTMFGRRPPAWKLRGPILEGKR